jgi:hypothetical protein
VTGRPPCPTHRALLAGSVGDWRRRVARDRASREGLSRRGPPLPCVARGTPAGARARRRGMRGGRARGARERACDHAPRGTRGRRRVGSPRRTALVETTPGTPCSDVEEGFGPAPTGTTRRRSRGDRQGARARWITIPPGECRLAAAGVDHAAAAEWIRTSPPLKTRSRRAGAPLRAPRRDRSRGRRANAKGLTWKASGLAPRARCRPSRRARGWRRAP